MCIFTLATVSVNFYDHNLTSQNAGLVCTVAPPFVLNCRTSLLYCVTCLSEATTMGKF